MALTIDPPYLLARLEAGDSDAVAGQLLNILRHFANEHITEPSDALTTTLAFTTKLVLHIWTDDRFVVPRSLAPEFIKHNTTLTNLVRLSGIGHVDLFIQRLLEKPDSLAKVLTLYSPYSRLDLDIDGFFNADAYLASLWVAAIMHAWWKMELSVHTFAARLLSHPAMQRYILSDPRYPLAEDACFAYFDATYVDPEKDRAFRDIINARIQKDFNYDYKNSNPNFRRILIVSAFFYKGHAVYRCLAPMIASLRPHYHVALFYLGVGDQEQLDHELFDEIHTTGAKDYSASFTHEMLDNILRHNYGVVVLPDVGLSRPSMIFANLRLAPIQITTYGHPVTTGNTCIDYFIAGKEVESAKNPQRYFAEVLALIPGIGVEAIRQNYEPVFPVLEENTIEIGLSWGEMKFTAPHMERIKEILDKADRPVRFHALGISPERLTYLTARRDLEMLLGEKHVRVTPFAGYSDYMHNIENCHLLLDSDHFGSYTRLIDALICKKPMITLEGTRSYQRFAAALLRRCGLEMLIAKTPEAFVALALRWIGDAAFRGEIAAKLAVLDLETAVFASGNARYFKSAIDAIVAHHRGEASAVERITIAHA